MDFDALLRHFAAAASRGDGARLVSLFTPDGCYDDGFFGPHRGHEAIAGMLQRFFVGGEAFAWEFAEPLSDGRTGYARYCFSYRSKEPESAGRLVCFEGMARFRLRDGLIEDYAEVFDRGVAFSQLGYAAPRVGKLLARYAEGFRQGEWARQHLARREAEGG